MKKLISIVLSILIVFSASCVVATAADTAEPFEFSVNEEGYAVLTYCDPGLEGEVSIPAVVEIDGEFYEVKSIGENAFEGCELITVIELSEGIEQIGEMAFLNCTALTDVYIPESLVFCSYTAFNGTSGVVIHCYSLNYQVFTVFAVIQSLRIDIVDSVGDDLDFDTGIEGVGSVGVDLTNTIILVVKRIIQMILYFFLNYGTDVEPDEDFVEPDSSATFANTSVALF